MKILLWIKLFLFLWFSSYLLECWWAFTWIIWNTRSILWCAFGIFRVYFGVKTGSTLILLDPFLHSGRLCTRILFSWMDLGDDWLQSSWRQSNWFFLPVDFSMKALLDLVGFYCFSKFMILIIQCSNFVPNLKI